MNLKETQPDQYPSTRLNRRLAKEFARLQEDPISGISAGPRGDNLYLWDCVMLGPPGTPWEEGSFQLTVSIADDYPIGSTSIRFENRIFHPNVFPDGTVCADSINTPALTIPKRLLTIQSLLDDPGLESPANPEAARLYSTNRRKYNRKVREICAATRRTTELYPINGGLIGFESSKQAEPSVARDDSGSSSSVIRTDDIGSTSSAVAGDGPGSPA